MFLEAGMVVFNLDSIEYRWVSVEIFSSVEQYW